MAGVILLARGQLKRERGLHENTWIYHIGDGFHYHVNSRCRDNVYLKCVKYERGCRGRAIYYSLTRGFEHSKPHDNKNDPNYVGELRLRYRIIQRCRSLRYTSFRQIVEEEGRRFPRAVRMRVPLSRIRPAMQRVRKSLYPHPPHSLRAFTQLLQNPRYRLITMSHDGEDNLYAGSVTPEDDSHHVILASRRMLRFAQSLQIFFSDGTFKTTPAIPGVAQIFIIIGNWRHHIIPIAWILMESMTEAAYTAVLRVLRLFLRGAPNLQRIITDFERAQQNAWLHVFPPPETTLQGCFFHFVRALIFYAKNTLHMGAYIRRGPGRLIMRLCSALPLLPRHLIVRGFSVVLKEAYAAGIRVYRRMRPFFAYLVRRWIYNPHRRMTMCVHGSVHRTNNSCESHNTTLSWYLDRKHADYYTFLDVLITMEDKAATDILVLQDGRNPSRRRRAFSILCDRRLTSYCDDLRNPPGNINAAITLFLHRGAYLFENMFNDAVENL